MALTPGFHLGPYEVLAAIGAGGMGEVYRATDRNLKRSVAIKVLPASVAGDADRLARFLREAEVLAALNHPSIAAIYGLERTADLTALVMELVEGEDLSQRIANGAIPIDEAVPIAKQIAEALEAAHEQGIIHRDLKPANIKVRSDGTVKVLDFGLAKALEPGSAPSSNVTMSPTTTSPAMMTGAGMILGTAAYMAPEQAKGRAVDKRADIWAFGVVLYEMLAGSHPFLADTIAETLAHVMTRPIDFGTLPAATPGPIRDLLARCLEKDAKKRLRDIGEARIRLEEVLSGVAEEPSGPAGAIAAYKRRAVPWLATAAVTLAMAALAFVHFREVPVTAPLINSSLNAPEGAASDFGLSSTVASGGGTPELSPDGNWIVFGARTADNKTSLWIRALSSSTAATLTGAEGATFPFWSPDSRYVAFFSGGKLKKVNITGGPPIPIADAPNARGGSWSPEGVIVFSPEANGPLHKIAASGGTSRPATSVKNAEVHRFPWFLPDGHHFLFEEQRNRGSIEVVLRIGSLDSLQTVEIGRASSNAVYSSGYMLFLREATLMAQPFDPDKRTVQGEAVPVVAEQVSWVLNDGRKGVFTVSSSGLLAYQAGGDARNQELSWFDRAGKVVTALTESGDLGAVKLSPDDKRAAVGTVDASGNTELWIHDLRRNLATRFTFDPAQDRGPVWSPPDGGALVWTSIGGKRTLRRKSADSVGTEEVLYEDANIVDVTSWSPDGKFLLIDKFSSGTGSGIWSLPITEKPGSPLKPTAFVEGPSSEGRGVFSPDGNWVAYVSNESQRNEIYVTPFPGPGGKTQISKTGGVFPLWRGKEIFWAGLDGKLMVAEVTPKASSIEVGQVKPLGITVPIVRGIPYDVSIDGHLILAITERDRTSATPLTLVQSWTSLLQKVDPGIK